MSIFDKVGNGVMEARNTLSQKARDISEQSRISSEIAGYKIQREENIKTLGEKVYEARMIGTEPTIDELIENIRMIDQFIRNLTGNLEDIKGVIACAGCGRTISRSSTFCPECGRKVELSDTLICPRCGRKLELGTKFCVGCGTKVG